MIHAQQKRADLVLLHGDIFTVDSAHPRAQAVAVSGNRIAAVGSDAEIQPWVGPKTRVVDLEGRLAIPGFIDGHGHYTGLGESKLVLDLTGLDVGIQQRRKALATRPADRRYPDLGMALCDLGRLGQKTGRGWYRYEEGSRTPVPDPELRPIIAKYADERGIAQREIGRDEILERCLFSIVNEGARLVELGVALRPSDVDVVQLLGYGFPKKRGGPLYFADQVGLSNVLSHVEHYHRTVGADWAPSELLVRLAADNGHFADLNQAASMVTA